MHDTVQMDEEYSFLIPIFVARTCVHALTSFLDGCGSYFAPFQICSSVHLELDSFESAWSRQWYCFY